MRIQLCILILSQKERETNRKILSKVYDIRKENLISCTEKVFEKYNASTKINLIKAICSPKVNILFTFVRKI